MCNCSCTYVTICLVQPFSTCNEFIAKGSKAFLDRWYHSVQQCARGRGVALATRRNRGRRNTAVDSQKVRSRRPEGPRWERAEYRKGQPHCFRGVKGGLTANSPGAGGIGNKCRSTAEGWQPVKRGRVKCGRGLERFRVFRKCKCQVNSSSEQPFSTRGGSRPL